MRYVTRILFPFLLCWLMLPPAMANLMLHPSRVVLDKNQRSAQIELINDGTESATYRIGVINRRMTETGEFGPVDTPLPGEQFADAMLRFSPRQVTLAPGATQTVRVMLRKPAELAAGEYRSHLHFEKLPDAVAPSAPASDAASDKDKGQVGVVIKVLMGASIPVIVRHGDTTAAVQLTGLALRDADGPSPQLLLQLERSGNSSAYGDLTATFTPRGGKPVEVARVGGVAVYTPNPLRRASLALKPPKGVSLAGGELRLTYRERPDAGGKLLAEATLPLP
jgi:P pilus assembly chaperone PapD